MRVRCPPPLQLTADRADSELRPDWLRPQVEHPGLRQYVQVLRERRWIVVGAIAVSLLAAILYLVTADKVYKSSADLLVAPVPSDDALLVSLGLIRQSGEPTRDVETAARLASNIDVATRARDDLGLDQSAESLLDEISVEPVAQSNLVSIEAEGSTPKEAADKANAFADAVIADRSAALSERIDEILPQLTARLEAESTGVVPAEGLRSEISRLEVLREGGDPTIQLEVPATPPDGQASPRPALTIGAALFVGLVVGLGGAFSAQALDPRLSREEQLRSSYSLPILARIPRERSTGRDRALSPGRVSGATMEAYRTLRANIAAPPSASGRGQSILVTGSAPREGKTTTAINLAASFALAGNRVILIEADLRRPAIADALGVDAKRGVASTLLENTSLQEALVTTTQFGGNLGLLLADYRGGIVSELFSLRAAQRLLDQATELADYVIIDSPPLTAVVDTLSLAARVDDVLVVSRLGLTRLDRLRELAELLAGNGISPIGFTLVGTPRPASSYYYEGLKDRERPDDEIVISGSAPAREAGRAEAERAR